MYFYHMNVYNISAFSHISNMRREEREKSLLRWRKQHFLILFPVIFGRKMWFCSYFLLGFTEGDAIHWENLAGNSNSFWSVWGNVFRSNFETSIEDVVKNSFHLIWIMKILCPTSLGVIKKLRNALKRDLGPKISSQYTNCALRKFKNFSTRQGGSQKLKILRFLTFPGSSSALQLPHYSNKLPNSLKIVPKRVIYRTLVAPT